MNELIIAIALLCGGENSKHSLSAKEEALSCQKYYFECAFKESKALARLEEWVIDSDSLRACVLKKK